MAEARPEPCTGSRLMSPRVVLVAAAFAALASACSGAPGSSSPEELASSHAALNATPQVSGSSIASLALANVGGSACGDQQPGGHSFDSSCTGNGGLPEYWCADFARWVWENVGARNTSELTAAAGSFYVYGQNHGTLKSTPALGDAVVFDYQGGGVADHVALVTKVNSRRDHRDGERRLERPERQRGGVLEHVARGAQLARRTPPQWALPRASWG